MQSSHQPLTPGQYKVKNFQGEHANPVPFSWGNTIYKHDDSTAIVNIGSNGGVDIIFNLCPTLDGRPFLGSINSQYCLTLHGVKVNSSNLHDSLTIEMITVQNAKHDIKGLGQFIGDTINGVLTSDEIGSNSISIKITHQGSSNYKLDMVVKPNEINFKTEGLAGSAICFLQTLGLFKETTITGHLHFDANPSANQQVKYSF